MTKNTSDTGWKSPAGTAGSAAFQKNSCWPLNIVR